MTPQEENARIQQEVNEQMLAYNEAQRTATKETEKAAAAEEKFAQVTTTALGVLEKLYQAQLRYTLAMAKGQKGTAQFNDGIDAMTDAAQMAAVALSLLVPGGAIIKGVTAGLTFLATQVLKTAAEMQKAANDQADATYKSFQAFSKAGATASSGMTGLFNDVNRMRLNVNQLDAIAGAIAASSKEISAFGGTVYRGQKEFADLVEGMGDFEKGMLNLGMNHEEQAEAVLGYMKIQSQLTLGEQRNYGNQSKVARKFIEEMEVMTRVTGLSRKQQEDVLDRQMSNQRSGAVLDQLTEEGKTEAVELLRKQVQIYAKMGPMAEQGYNDILSGNLQTEAAQKLFRSTNGKVMQDQIDIMEGRVRTDREAVADTQETVGIMAEQRKNFRESFKAGVEDVLIPFKELGEAAKLKASGLEEAMADATIQVDKLTGAQGKVEEVTDKYTDVLKKQNDEMLALQKSLHGTFSPAGVGVAGFTSILERTGGILIELGNKTKDLLYDLLGLDKKHKGGQTDEALAYGGSPDDAPPPVVPHPTDATGRKLSAVEIAQQSSATAQQHNAQRPKGAVDSAVASLRSMLGITGPAPAPAGGAPAPAPAGGGAPAPAGGKPAGGKPVVMAPPPKGFDPNAFGSAEGKVAGAATVNTAGALPFGAEQQGKEVRIGKEIRKGGSVAWRTNNPGNVSWSGIAKHYGAIGTWRDPNGDSQQRGDGIAIMPNEAAGDALKVGLWRRPMYNDLTIDLGVQQWAEAAKKEGRGSNYAKDLARAAGATLDTILGTLTDQQLTNMVKKQRVWESWRPGSVVQAAQGGVFDGPKSGYSATLHGNEAVIPLKDGAVPVSMSQEFNMTATNLGELVNQMRSTMGVQERMITVLEEIRRAQTTTADNTSRMAAYASN